MLQAYLTRWDRKGEMDGLDHLPPDVCDRCPIVAPYLQCNRGLMREMEDSERGIDLSFNLKACIYLLCPPVPYALPGRCC